MKYGKYVVLVLLIFLFMPFIVSAETITTGTTTSNLNIRTGPSTENGFVYCADQSKVSISGTVTILETPTKNSDTSADKCPSKQWYKVSGKDIADNQVYTGYGCSDYIENITTTDTSKTDNTPSTPSNYNFETELSKFPDSYKDKLRALHSAHPTWEFYAENTGLDWNVAVENESYSSKKLVSISKRENYGWIWLDSSNYDWKTDTPKVYQGHWYIPTNGVVAYNMDPRNYLDEQHVFAFLSNSYRGQSEEGVSAILSGTFMSDSYTENNVTKKYSSTFLEAGIAYNVSPYMLASRSKQEVSNGTEPSGSASGTYVSPTVGNTTYGYYNFYNIGATGDNAITNGLLYAKEHGWDTRYKAILGGASFLADNYISRMQDNLYFQNFNTISEKYNKLYRYYANQYMQNVEATMSESVSTYTAYAALNMLNQNLVFDIPVYSGTMNETSEPAIWPASQSGNPNNWLTDIQIDGTTLSGFDGNTLEYNYTIEYNTKSITISTAKTVQGSTSTSVPSTVNGDGVIVLDLNTSAFTQTVKVTAQNGNVRNYIIHITRKDKPKTDDNGNVIYPTASEVLDNVSIKYNSNYVSGYAYGTTYTSFDDLFKRNVSLASYSINKNSNNNTNHFATGDVINITINGNLSQYNYVLYGDLNGDGEINLSDLVHCRKILLGTSNLTGANTAAADVNKDGSTNLTDLILIRKHLLGTALSQ